MNKKFKFIYMFSLPVLLAGCSTTSTYSFVPTSTSGGGTSTSTNYETDYESQITRGIGYNALEDIINLANDNLAQLKTSNTTVTSVLYEGEETTIHSISQSARLFNNDVKRIVYSGADEEKEYFGLKEEIENGGYLSSMYFFSYNNHSVIMLSEVYTIQNSSYENIVTTEVGEYSLYNYDTYFKLDIIDEIPSLDSETYNPIAGYLNDGTVYASITTDSVALYDHATLRREFIFDEERLITYNQIINIYSDETKETLVGIDYFSHSLSYTNNGNLTNVPINIPLEDETSANEEESI